MRDKPYRVSANLPSRVRNIDPAMSYLMSVIKGWGYEDRDGKIEMSMRESLLNSIVWGNKENGLPVHLLLELCFDRAEFTVTDRGTEVPAKTLYEKIERVETLKPDEMIDYISGNAHSRQRGGIGLFLLKQYCDEFSIEDVMNNGEKTGTRVHMVYKKK